MSINLLSLARSSSSGLHNSGRGRGKSYAPGTTYGNKIAGTNIRQGAGLKNLAKKGRTSPVSGKDTKIRKVAGKPSHVNKLEASVIDKMGPLGEAWVQSVGSGTTNPKTGLKEYGWFSDLLGTTGSGGLFGGYNHSIRMARQEKANAAARKAAFEDYRRKYEKMNVASLFTESTVDDAYEGYTPAPEQYASKGVTGYEDWILDESGLFMHDDIEGMREQSKATQAAASKLASGGLGGMIGDLMTQVAENQSNAATKLEGSQVNDIRDYTSEYNPRKENELKSTFENTVKAAGVQLDKKMVDRVANQEAMGSQLSTQLFGQLTQTKEMQKQQNFANVGGASFKDKFQQDELFKNAQRTINAGKTDFERDKEESKIALDEATDNLTTDVMDLQDAYNQKFWSDMVSWESAQNA